MRVARLLALAFLLPMAALADLSPAILKQVGYDQRLSASLPLGLSFRDAHGRAVHLSDYFRAGRPVVIVLGYYRCPNLCSTTLHSLIASLRAIPFTVGKEFDVVMVGIDPRETPAIAARQGATYVRDYGHGPAGWHFLTGDANAVHRLAAAVGFRYVYDAQAEEFVHPAGAIVVTGAGRISRYLYGVDFPPRDLRLSLIDAAHARIGSPVDYLLLLCCSYNPVTGTYDFWIWHALRFAGFATVAVLALAIAGLVVRERRGGSRL